MEWFLKSLIESGSLQDQVTALRSDLATLAKSSIIISFALFSTIVVLSITGILQSRAIDKLKKQLNSLAAKAA